MLDKISMAIIFKLHSYNILKTILLLSTWDMVHFNREKGDLKPINGFYYKYLKMYFYFCTSNLEILLTIPWSHYMSVTIQLHLQARTVRVLLIVSFL